MGQTNVHERMLTPRDEKDGDLTIILGHFFIEDHYFSGSYMEFYFFMANYASSSGSEQPSYFLAVPDGTGLDWYIDFIDLTHEIGGYTLQVRQELSGFNGDQW